MDGESSSPEGGPDTPPNTPVIPSHKTTMEHHKQWRELEKSEPGPAACLGQHHHQRHHFHDHNHHSSYKHHNGHSPVFEKKLYNPQGICDVKVQPNNYVSSIYSCYQAHWCIASVPSTPCSSPTPASPTLSLSSKCSSEGELGWQQPSRPRTITEKNPDQSTCKSVGGDDDDDDDDADQNSDQNQDYSGNLPNPGILPLMADTKPSFSLPFNLPS